VQHGLSESHGRPQLCRVCCGPAVALCVLCMGTARISCTCADCVL
jgi:hypothetical protein